LKKVLTSIMALAMVSTALGCVTSETPSPAPSKIPSVTPPATPSLTPRKTRSPSATKVGDFSIYLLADEVPASELSILALEDLELQDKPFLSSTDIIAYTEEGHEIELTAEAYDRVRQLFASPVPVLGIPFVVSVGAERIYSGAFWTPASSISFDGVVICEPFDVDRHVIKIVLGYPSREAFTAKDPRSDPRTLQSLAAAGKLK
jgi:hypothetical protein